MPTALTLPTAPARWTALAPRLSKTRRAATTPRGATTRPAAWPRRTHVGRGVAALAGLLLLAGCHHPAKPVLIPGAGVPGTELQAAVVSLCQARDQAGNAAVSARDIFYVQAHQRLHLEAQALAEVDRPAASRLLVDIQRVEADLTPTPAAPSLAADLTTVTSTAADGLARLAVPAPPCARP